MPVTIRYTNDDRPYPGVVITPGPDWRNDAAYYLTMPGYRLIDAVCSIECIKCKGNGRIKTRRRGVLLAYKDCPSCKGAGQHGEVPLDVTTISATEYRQR